MTATPHPIAAPVDRDAVFARWEQRLARRATLTEARRGQGEKGTVPFFSQGTEKLGQSPARRPALISSGGQ